MPNKHKPHDTVPDTSVSESEAITLAAEAETPALAEPNLIQQLEEKIALLTAEKEENWAKYLTSEADKINMKRRAERDVSEAHKYAIDKFVRELLPIIDSMELGLESIANTDDTHQAQLQRYQEGMTLTYKMLVTMMEKIGLKVVNPLGEKLNPEHHQAMSMQASAEHAPGTVIQVFQKGYLLNDRLVRPALVIVAQAG